MEFDHLFVGTNDIDSAASAMKARGFIEGSSNEHPGQGTANRRYFFTNAMIELLYVDEGVSSNHPQNHLLELEARCQASIDNQSISKLGVCFRPSSSGLRRPDFDCLQYTPSYLPEALHIDIDSERRAGEPLWFHLPFTSEDLYRERTALEPRSHSVGVSRISQVQIDTTADSLSPTAESISQVTGLSVKIGSQSLVTVDFDDRAQGHILDLRPLLPMILRT